MATAEADPLELRLLYSPHRPEPPQHAFLLLDELGVEEALYGGAAGGGKSDAILMSALRYVDVPRYAALILRRSYPDLFLPGAIGDRAKEWLAGSDARWSEVDFRFTFPSTATLTFGYLKTANDRYRYQGAEFQFVGFDELTQFPEADYTYLFSRLRGPDPDEYPDDPLAHIPIRMRAASNPGGRGHEFVKRRFIDKLPRLLEETGEPDPEDTPEVCRARIFIPAKLDDNPHVDRRKYEANLAHLTSVERARLRDGDWNADDGSKYFNGNNLDAVVALGEELLELTRRGEMPAPVGGALPLGIDWGDNTHGVLGWPLEAGGLWVIASEELIGLEPGTATDRLLDLPAGAPPWPGKPKGTKARPIDPVRLLGDVRYDAAGLQSMRTFAKRARVRRLDLRVTKIDFNRYKREAALYLKLLAERAGDGHTTRVLAITPLASRVLIRQMRGLLKDPKDPELWLKEDDHGPDALVALVAPIAARNRSRTSPRKAPPPTSSDAIRGSQRP